MRIVRPTIDQLITLCAASDVLLSARPVTHKRHASNSVDALVELPRQTGRRFCARRKPTFQKKLHHQLARAGSSGRSDADLVRFEHRIQPMHAADLCKAASQTGPKGCVRL